MSLSQFRQGTVSLSTYEQKTIASFFTQVNLLTFDELKLLQIKST